jgi:hypothetical protein
MREHPDTSAIAIEAISKALSSIGNQANAPQVAPNSGNGSVECAGLQRGCEIKPLFFASAWRLTNPCENSAGNPCGIARQASEQLVERNVLQLAPINDFKRISKGTECRIHEVTGDKEAEDGRFAIAQLDGAIGGDIEVACIQFRGAADEHIGGQVRQDSRSKRAQLTADGACLRVCEEVYARAVTLSRRAEPIEQGVGKKLGGGVARGCVNDHRWASMLWDVIAFAYGGVRR